MCIASSIVVNLTIVPAILHCPLGTYILCKRNIQWTYFKLKSYVIWQRCSRQVSRKWQMKWKHNSKQSETVESILEKTEGYTSLQDLINVNRNDNILIDNCTIETRGKNNRLLNYQGLHDIVTLFLINLKSPSLPFLIVGCLYHSHLRDPK